MRTNMLASLVVAAGLSLTAAGSAQAQQVEGDTLRTLVEGKTIFLETPFGEFPLVYNADGSVTGDGTDLGLARYFAPRETGQWWIEGPNLCQQFPTWYDGEASCFVIEKTSETTINWQRDDGQAGKARIEG